MIEHLTIRNFKKFQNSAVELLPFTVLMGENGSGKTTILQALAVALRSFSSTDLLTYNPRTRKVAVRAKAVSAAQLPGLDVEKPPDVFYARKAHGGRGGGTPKIELVVRETNGDTYRLKITTQFGAYAIKCESTAKDFSTEPRLIKTSPLFISGFVGLPSAEERLFPVAIDDRLARGRASDILRNLLLDTREKTPDKFTRLGQKMKTHFAFSLGAVNFEQNKDLFVHADYRETLGGEDVGLDLTTAGSGFLQVLQILAPIYRFAADTSTVLLDEPDAHLHPNLQRTLARVLGEIAKEENLQIIASTHSTAIIRAADPGSVVPVSSTHTVLAPLAAADEVESEISARVDNFTAGKMKISGRILFVEDSRLVTLRRIDQLAGTSIFEGPGGLPVVSAQGKDDKLPFRIHDALKKIAQTDVQVMFIRDGDGLPVEWQKQLRKHALDKKVRLMLLPFHEIESVLLSPPLIQRALSAKGHDVSVSSIKSQLVKTMREVVGRTTYGFQDTLRDSLYKTARAIGKDYAFQDAERDSRQLVGEYEQRRSFDDLRAVAPAKETLTEFRKWVDDKYSVQVSEAGLRKELQLTDLPDGLVTALKKLIARPKTVGGKKTSPKSRGAQRRKTGTAKASTKKTRKGT